MCPRSIGLTLVIFQLLVVTASSALDDTLPVEVELGGIGHEFVYDRVGQILYASVPSLGEIVAISTVDFSIVDRILVGSQPRGIDLNADGTELFAALNGAGSVAIVDLDTNAISRINIGAELDDPRTWDVVEGQTDRLFVSSNPGSNGFAYIVEILRDSGNAAQRVASNRIIRASPVFAVDPDERFLYVGSGFSPNSLYKLDMAIATAPIILEDDHGSVSGTNALEVNLDGMRIHLGSGQVLRTGSFVDDERLVGGIARYGDTPGVVYVAEYRSFGGSETTTTVHVYDTSTYFELESFTLPCAPAGFSRIADFVILPGDTGFLILADDLACGFVGGGSTIDDDQDGVVNGLDNCPDTPNPEQTDGDEDGLGDPCDPFPDEADNLGQCLEATTVDQVTIAALEADNAAQLAEIERLEAELAECSAGGADDDGDGVDNSLDLCAETPAGMPVDADGCSVPQFCSAIEINITHELLSCARARWQPNETDGRRKRSRRSCQIKYVGGEARGWGGFACRAR
jgi:DNA-binding beta-propeller fold protein YncE